MDTFSVVTGVSLLVVFVFFMWYANYKEASKQKAKIKILNDYATKQGLSLSETGNIKDKMIGIDKINNKVCFVDSSKNVEITIDLINFVACRFNEVFKSEETKNGFQRFLDKVELVFNSKDSKIASVSLELYREEDLSTQLSGELQFAQKWAQLIHAEIVDLRQK